MRYILLAFFLFPLISFPVLAQDAGVSVTPPSSTDWKRLIVGRKVMTDENGVRSVELPNERRYVFTGDLLIEYFDDERMPVAENVYDFDTALVVHKFRDIQKAPRRCRAEKTLFKDMPPERIEEMRSLSCFILGSWYSLVSRGLSNNPFYHNHCKGRYDDR